jgi:hypothetical protein
MREAKRSAGATGPKWLELAHLAAVVLAVAVLAGFAPACSSDDGGGGTNTIACLQYESSGVPGALTVTTPDVAPNDNQCNFLYVDLMVNGVQDLFAANFVVTYPNNVVGFSAADGLGSVLADDNTAVQVIPRVTNAGEVTIAITRLGAETGIDVLDDGVGKLLIRLVFIRAASSGSGNLEFTTGELLNSGDPEPDEIPNSVWTGGTIGIVQI